MIKRLALPVLLMAITDSNASDFWVNDGWSDGFIRGLWEGCILKSIDAADYVSKTGTVTAIEIRASKEPFLVEVKRTCNCQTQYFQDHHASENLKYILMLDPSDESYKNLLAEVPKECF